MRVYLAGKVEKHCWRHALVRDLRSGPGFDGIYPPDKGVPVNYRWPVMEGAVLGGWDYVGPYFTSCDHGCAHSEPHGFATEGNCGDFYGDPVLVQRLCLEAIDRADVVFAWITGKDCYGTLIELGYAVAREKEVFIAGPRRFRDLWFVYECARRIGLTPSFDHSLFGPDTAEEAFRTLAPLMRRCYEERSVGRILG
jgi:hypothetical protein